MKVNTTKHPSLPRPTGGWPVAVGLVAQYLDRPCRADSLLAAERPGMDARDFATAQQLFYSVLRNLSLLKAALERLCVKKPSAGCYALLMVAGAELMRDGSLEQRAKVTDHAVRMAEKLLSPGMKGFVNAVVRRLPESMEKVTLAAPSECAALALRHSHPEWLVARWMTEFGPENTKTLLEWNQTVPPVYLRMESGQAAPDALSPSAHEGYLTYNGTGWDKVDALLSAGKAYAQDPSTGLCVQLLAPAAGEKVLDLCASPGGKARQMLPKIGEAGRVVCVDLPDRVERLAENLHGRANASILSADLFDLTPALFASKSLPESYDAVLLDAPCSNTGVLRRRPDARWRLGAGDIEQCAALQLRLLGKAAEFVAPGGRLVYSTCSVERVENEAVADAFVQAKPGFAIVESKRLLPWSDGVDGAGATLFRRV